MSKQVKCDKCQSTSVAHSRRRGFEQFVVNFTSYKPYRCMHCYHRFWQASSWGKVMKKIFLVVFVVFVICLLLFLKATLSSSNKSFDEVVQQTNVSKPVLVSVNPESVGSIKGDSIEISQPVNLEEKNRTLRPLSKVAKVALQQLKENELAIKSENDVKQRELKKQLKGNDKEQAALYRVQISNFLKRWQNAWQTGDAKAYVDSYSGDYVSPKFHSHDKWKADRAGRISPTRKINVELKDLKLQFTDTMNSATVHFNQLYQSATYSDHSKKQLLIKKVDTAWKIFKEEELERLK